MAQELGYDPAEALRTLRKADPDLGRLMRKLGPFGLELRPCRNPFEGLAESIVYQQLHGKAAASIFSRVRDLYPGRRITPARILASADAELRGAGLSAAKSAALRDLSRKSLEGLVPSFKAMERLDDLEIIERLTRVQGIGRWTVEMLLIFRLGRPDVLPVDDFGIRKGFGLWFRDGVSPTPREVAAHGERWTPFRSAASWYLWQASHRL